MHLLCLLFLSDMSSTSSVPTIVCVKLFKFRITVLGGLPAPLVLELLILKDVQLLNVNHGSDYYSRYPTRMKPYIFLWAKWNIHIMYYEHSEFIPLEILFTFIAGEQECVSFEYDHKIIE